MYMFSMVIVASVALRLVYELLHEGKHDHTKEYMTYELDAAFNPRRGNILRGFFRKHSTDYKNHGINGPKGTA